MTRAPIAPLHFLTHRHGGEMAEELIGTCRSCGYSARAFLGAGRMDYGRRDSEPHRCLDCKRLVTVDVLAAKSCPECGSSRLVGYECATKLVPDGWIANMRYGRMNDAALRKAGFHRWDDVVSMASCPSIYADGNVCPRCQRNTFSFTLVDHYD